VYIRGGGHNRQLELESGKALVKSAQEGPPQLSKEKMREGRDQRSLQGVNIKTKGGVSDVNNKASFW